MIMPCGLSIIKEVLSECPSGRRGEWEKGRVGDGKNLPSSFFRLPYSFFLTSVTSVTSVTESVAELPSSFLIKLKSQSAIAKPKPKLQPNCKQPQSSPLRY